MLQGGGQLVDVLPQQAYLIAGTPLVLRLEIQVHHLFRYAVELQDGFGDFPGNEPDDDAACQSDHDSHIGQETVGNLGALPNALHRSVHDEGNAGAQPTVHFQEVALHRAHPLHHIVLAFLYHFHRIVEEAEHICGQTFFQLRSAVHGGVLQHGVRVHDIDRDIVHAADIIQFLMECPRAVCVAVRRLPDRMVGFEDHFCLAPDIILLQEQIIHDPA